MRGREAATLALASLAATAAWADFKYPNLTAGGSLRPGVYGRIEVGAAPPPPLIFPQPVVATQSLAPAAARPLYLYVPPGQVRKWDRACAKWNACDVPVLFVRMDDSPSRFGRWKQARGEAYALRPE